MRSLLLAAALTASVAVPAFAQTVQTERGYISGIGGFAVTPDATDAIVTGHREFHAAA